jgi:hypothetical protein
MSCCAIARNVVEATNASRILRTRGDMGRRRLLETVAVPDFLTAGFVVLGAEGLAVCVDAGFAEDF